MWGTDTVLQSRPIRAPAVSVCPWISSVHGTSMIFRRAICFAFFRILLDITVYCSVVCTESKMFSPAAKVYSWSGYLQRCHCTWKMPVQQEAAAFSTSPIDTQHNWDAATISENSLQSCELMFYVRFQMGMVSYCCMHSWYLLSKIPRPVTDNLKKCYLSYWFCGDLGGVSWGIISSINTVLWVCWEVHVLLLHFLHFLI